MVVCKGLPGIPDWVTDFDGLCRWQESVFGRSRSDVACMMYTPEHVSWLALFLAQRNTRLDYQKLWDTGKARAVATGAWVFACEFDREHAARTQSKIERFLNTSPLTSCRSFTVKVPTRNLRTLAIVKHHVHDILSRVRQQSPWWSMLLAKKIKVVRGKCPTLSQLVPSCIQVARCHDASELDGVDKKQASMFDLRHDVLKSGLYWDIPLEHSDWKMKEIVFNQLHRMLNLYKLGHLNVHIGTLVSETSYIHVDENQSFLEAYVRDHVGSMLAVPVDKDPKRRVLMDRLGFLHRLHQGYVHDDRFFVLKKRVGKEDLALLREHIGKKFLPSKVASRKRFDAGTCQYAYHTYKGKCLAPSGGLSCTKDHAHEREIVSDFHNPCKKHLRLVARAVRLIKMLSGERTWTLWRQSQLKPVLKERVAHLKGHADCKIVCPCGKKKGNELSLIKIDAAQFFKAASLERGLERVRSLLTRVEQQGYDAVAVRKSARCAGFLCKSIRASDQSAQVVPFSVIRDTLSFIYHDRYFTVGSLVMKRKGGWPMGGSFSEPGTLVDLSEEIRLLDENSGKLVEVGWNFKGWKLHDLVSGLMHVDDAVVFSRIFCPGCLEQGMKRLWPQDVGISLEEIGPTVRMLHSHIHIIGLTVHIRPYNPNTSFALGFSSEQKVARLGPFLGQPFHEYADLQKFLHAKILAYNHLVQGDYDNMFVYVGVLLLEIVKLQWPEKFIRKALCSLPRRHVSPLISACRGIGRQLRRCKIHDVFGPEVLIREIVASPVENAVHSDMSKQWRPPHGGQPGWRNWSDRGRPNQHSEPALSREVVDFVREEQRRRAEERQASEVQKQTKDTVMRMFGLSPTASGSTSVASSGSQDKTPPFEMLKWIAGRIMKKTTGGSDSEERKAKSRKRKKTRSTSSTSSSDSSMWAHAKKRKEKKRSDKKERKDKKTKDEKKGKSAAQPRKLAPLTSSPAQDEAKKNDLSKDRRLELAKELKVEGKLSAEHLESDEWKTELAHIAKKEDILKLAEKNLVQKSGSKHEIIERLVAYMLGK